MEETEQILGKVEDVEAVAEELLIARRELVEADRLRNGNREALTALRRQARTSRSSLFSSGASAAHSDGDASTDGKRCPTCGDLDGSIPTWKWCTGADVFIRLPFHQIHCELEKEQVELESQVKVLQSTVRDTAYLLSEKGAISDVISPGLMESFVKLKG